uniref:Calmodulin n=2 Tax=Macrostomum lignano TaxID=282301 RepID=A0A1I8G0Q7_9PLAT
MADPESLKAVFDYFDRDGTGTLELDELEELLNALGQCVTKEEVRSIMAADDINSDGVMSLSEFIEFYKRHGKDAAKVGQEIGDAFKRFDRNNRGYLSKTDMETILTKGGAFPFTKEEAEMCFDAFDLNKDGQMDYGEFANFLCTICPTFEDLEKLNDRQ